MTIQFICSHCRVSLKAPDDKAGLCLACPKCRQAVTVPVPFLDEEEIPEVLPVVEPTATDEPWGPPLGAAVQQDNGPRTPQDREAARVARLLGLDPADPKIRKSFLHLIHCVHSQLGEGGMVRIMDMVPICDAIREASKRANRGRIDFDSWPVQKAGTPCKLLRFTNELWGPGHRRRSIEGAVGRHRSGKENDAWFIAASNRLYPDDLWPNTRGLRRWPCRHCWQCGLILPDFGDQPFQYCPECGSPSDRPAGSNTAVWVVELPPEPGRHRPVWLLEVNCYRCQSPVLFHDYFKEEHCPRCGSLNRIIPVPVAVARRRRQAAARRMADMENHLAYLEDEVETLEDRLSELEG